MTTHAQDKARGRASVRMCWTVCGRTVACRLTSFKFPEVTCANCQALLFEFVDSKPPTKPGARPDIIALTEAEIRAGVPWPYLPADQRALNKLHDVTREKATAAANATKPTRQ